MARKGGSSEIAALKAAEAEAQSIVNAAREGGGIESKRHERHTGIIRVATTWPSNKISIQIDAAERKLKMRQAQAEAKKEIDEYRAMREAKLRSVQPEVRRGVIDLRWSGSCDTEP